MKVSSTSTQRIVKQRITIEIDLLTENENLDMESVARDWLENRNCVSRSGIDEIRIGVAKEILKQLGKT